jgi:hypothetical protein
LNGRHQTGATDGESKPEAPRFQFLVCHQLRLAKILFQHLAHFSGEVRVGE